MHSRPLFLLSCLAFIAPTLRAQTPSSVQAVQLDDYIVETNRATFDQKAPAVTAQVLAEDMRVLNLTTPEDTLKNLPNIYIRRRFIGDKNAIVGIRGTSMRQTGRTVVYADGMLLSNFLATGFGNSPRWFLLAPEEIATCQRAGRTVLDSLETFDPHASRVAHEAESYLVNLVG